MSEPLTRSERRDIEDVLDRVRVRLRDSERGLHGAGEPASKTMLEHGAKLGIPPAALALWADFDGVEVAHGESRVYALAEVEDKTRAARDAGIIGEHDLVIGSMGLDDLVLPEDPWEEGADVVLVGDDGQRSPFGSTLPRTVLALVARATVTMDESGEYREDAIGPDGELSEKAERKMCRRHLDVDEDAPLPRFRLGQLLRRSGKAHAARRELELTLRRAPSFAWAEFELGRACLDLDDATEARSAFERAVELADDEGFAGLLLAWAARAAVVDADEPSRARLAADARARYPGIVAAQEAGAREALEDERPQRAAELVALGLAVEPRHLGLLDLGKQLAPG